MKATFAVLCAIVSAARKFGHEGATEHGLAFKEETSTGKHERKTGKEETKTVSDEEWDTMMKKFDEEIRDVMNETAYEFFVKTKKDPLGEKKYGRVLKEFLDKLEFKDGGIIDKFIKDGDDTERTLANHSKFGREENVRITFVQLWANNIIKMLKKRYFTRKLTTIRRQNPEKAKDSMTDIVVAAEKKTEKFLAAAHHFREQDQNTRHMPLHLVLQA